MKMPAWIKSLMNALIQYGVSTLAGLTGFYAWAATQVARFGGRYLYDWVNWAWNTWQNSNARAKSQEEAKKKFEAIDNDPEKTDEEKAKAYQDFINSH